MYEKLVLQLKLKVIIDFLHLLYIFALKLLINIIV